MLALNSSNKFVVGVDLGTTNIVAAVGDLQGKILKEIRITTSRNHNVENIIRQVALLVDETISKSGVESDKIFGLGMAVAGQVEKDGGRILFSPHFNWRDIHIAELLEEKTGLKTVAWRLLLPAVP